MVANADPATSLMKYVVFAINFVIYVMGGAILAVGIWIRSDSDFWEYHRALDIPQFYQASYVAITLGAIVLIIGFFGCCGAAMNSPCMLFTYMVMIVFILILELTTAGLVWKHADGEKFQIFLTNAIKTQIDRGIHDNADSGRFVDLLQLHLECCGGFDMHDYHLDDIPQSCSSDRTNNVFIHGCGENMRRYLEQKAGALGGIALGSVLIQVLCLIFSGCLFCIMREDEREYI